MQRPFKVRLGCVVAATWVAGSLCASLVLAVETPNIVLITVDDLGWTSTSVQMDPDVADSRSDYYQTPSLESLAAAGMRFSDAYATPVCTPTRAALQTGKSSAQLQMTDVVGAADLRGNRYVDFYTGRPLSPPIVREFLPGAEETIPERIDKSIPAYKSGLFGKWHLSFENGLTPLGHGYHYANAGVSTPLPAEENPNHIFSITNLAVDFMEDRVAEEAPFFLNINHFAPHTPWQARPETLAKYENLPPGERHTNPLYAAMVEDMDAGIGQVLAAIDQLGIADNTYVIFASDNGPLGSKQATESLPLHDFKGTTYEGGVRVPMIVAGPGIAPGTVSRVPVAVQDLFATVTDLAGVSEPLGPTIESASLAPILENGGSLPQGMESLSRAYAPGGELFFHNPHYFDNSALADRKPSSAIRDGDYKLIRFYGEQGAPDRILLFNLAENLGESFDPQSPLNLADDLPGKTAELLGKLDRWLQDVDASLPYDVSSPTSLHWNADVPGEDARAWRSVNDVDHYFRERWEPVSLNGMPEKVGVRVHQPGLGHRAMAFTGQKGLSRTFLHVSDQTTPEMLDGDHSVALEFWVRLDSLGREQLLFESGGETAGLSLTIGDADDNGLHNDLRVRLLGADGQHLAATTPLDEFVDPTRDFVHIAAVYDDDPDRRGLEIYINGALRRRVDGMLGAEGSIDWDDVDRAGLGVRAGESLGAAGGQGDLPLGSAPLRGEIAEVRFFNHAVDAESIRRRYQATLLPATHGVVWTGGDAVRPQERPAATTSPAAPLDVLSVLHERSDQLTDALAVDALVTAEAAFSLNSPGLPGTLPVGTQLASYLLSLDPAGNDASALRTYAGVVEFEQDIVGILFDQAALATSDPALAVLGDYGPLSTRGLSLAGDDFLAVAADLRTLEFSLTMAGDEQSQFRVITRVPRRGTASLDGAPIRQWESNFGQSVPGDPSGDSDYDGFDLLLLQRAFLGTNADLDGNGQVEQGDLRLWEAALGVSDSGDVDGDGDSDGDDFLDWQRRTTSVFADLDRSGVVDELDLNRWQFAYGRFSDGDATGDGRSVGGDFLAWQRQATPSTGAAIPTPEPGTLVGLLLAGAAFVLRNPQRP